MHPSLFALGRLIILRVTSLREERPELLRRVGWGCWPCVISRTHQVHPHPRPRPRTRSSAQVSSAPPPTCRQVLTLCKKKANSSRRVSSIVEFNMNSGGLKFSLREVAFSVREVPPCFTTLPYILGHPWPRN